MKEWNNVTVAAITEERSETGDRERSYVCSAPAAGFKFHNDKVYDCSSPPVLKSPRVQVPRQGIRL